EERLVLLCGRYEGVDERIGVHYTDLEVSIGDYVLTGGELPALVVLDATVRLLPGVVGEERSIQEDSFQTGLLDYPHYTRPAEVEGQRVPEVLLSGNHEAIRRWRRKESLRRTRARRPDLLEAAPLTEEDQELLAEIEAEEASQG
ncbi:MAG: tRNA (guanine(37)-N(1))-methyltransferase, partial [Candidatus Tectimicrobiota bacterium]